MAPGFLVKEKQDANFIGEDNRYVQMNTKNWLLANDLL
jgi:hypothetical protein